MICSKNKFQSEVFGGVFFAFRNGSKIALKSLVSCYIKLDPSIISGCQGSARVPPSSAETSERNKDLNG